MSDRCLAVLQTAFQTLWQCFEIQSLGGSCSILEHAYIRNFLLGWRPQSGWASAYLFFGPGLWGPGLPLPLGVGSDVIG